MKFFSLVVRIFWLTCSILLASTVFGQDLGSSNSLFGGKKAKSGSTAKKTAPKTAVKRKPAAAPKRSPARSARASSKPVRSVGRPTKPVRKPDSTPVAVQKTKTEPVASSIAPVIISVPPVKTKPPVATVVPNAAADELYERLIVEGNAARDDRNYLVGESSYQRAKSVKPTDARAVYGLGNLYSDQQRWEEAETAYRAARQIDPSNAIIDVALSYVLSQPLMVPNLPDRYEEAEKLARRAIQLAPSNALAFDQLGVSLELRGLIDGETGNAYRSAIRLDPTFAPAYAHLGRLLRQRGRMSESAKAYDEAVRRATDVPTMIVIADVMQSEQRYAESEKLLRRAVEEDPKNPAGLLLLGKALTTLGNFSDAEKFLRKSLVITPNGFMPNSLLGTLYTRQGKYELAENSLLQALRFVSPNEKRNLAFRFETLGDGYMKSGKAGSAERTYRQAISLDPEKQSLAGKLARSQRG